LLSVRRNIDLAIAAHIALWNDFFDFPLRNCFAVEAEPIHVPHVLAKNGLPVARPNPAIQSDFALRGSSHDSTIGSVSVNQAKGQSFMLEDGKERLIPVGRPTSVARIPARDGSKHHPFARRYLHSRDAADPIVAASKFL